MAGSINSIPVQEMPPRDWLEYIRNKYLPEKPFIVAESHLEEFLSHLPSSAREDARRVWVRRHGKSIYAVLDELMDSYLREGSLGFKQEEAKIVQDALFAVLPTYDFNGYAGLTPRGDQVVILHFGIGMTLSFWSHWYLRLHEEGDNYITGHAERVYTTLHYFYKFWFGLDPGPHFPDIYPKTEDSWELDEAMTRGAISFVLGHEIGHILYKHRPYGSNQNLNHEMEFEADRKGLEVVIRLAFLSTAVLHKDNYFAKFILFGPLFAFAVMSLFGDKESDTHPSPSSRKDRLLMSYEPILKDIFKDKYDFIVSEVDDDLVGMLRRNSDNLFALLSTFRDTMDDMLKDAPPIDSSWVANEIKLD